MWLAILYQTDPPPRGTSGGGDDGDDDGGQSTGAIVAEVIGSIIGAILIIGCVSFCCYIFYNEDD